jgi:hypothetical protein
MNSLRYSRLRSNPLFRLISFDQLGAPEQRRFGSLSEETDFYGLLAPPPVSSLPVKSISRDAALLFLTLREPACVPHLLTSLFGTNSEPHVRKLVLDGVFEIEHEGRFLSGASALQLLGGVAAEVTTRISKLSNDAIIYAAALEGLTVSETAARLYMFNRAPCTPALQRKFASNEQLISYLVGHTALARQLASRWVREVSQGSWLFWRTPEPMAPLDFKLYISPTVDALPDAFRLILETFTQIKCTCFKVGITAFGLVRPDKLVAYFARLDDLQQAAELFRASAAGISAQGVPFTAVIDPEGLVSWGMDPPRFDQPLGFREHQSWREWITERIAVYTFAAKNGAAQNKVEFVLERLSLDGIDTTTWTPNLAIWRSLGGIPEDVS